MNTEGSNEIVAVATDAVGHQGNASVIVTRNTQSPEVEITSPKDSDTVHERFITVSGTVSDANLYDVRVNGVTAALGAGTFTATDVPLDFEGANTVTAVARDDLGQETGDAITVIRALPPQVAITEIVFSEQSTEEQARMRVAGMARGAGSGTSGPGTA